ncbi:ISNCY family transposase [Candidatus Saccharibacteria bacterium]|nr:ISNCY family transposase [Candidatus Saccharibacteria bacterium]NIW78850.1 ISNCY family transposase [Calditrichia bacterium]
MRTLQYIYTTPELNKKVFDILEEKITLDINPATGRPGMTLWEILVFGAIRLAREADYDHIHFVANFNGLIRQLVGISDFGKNEDDKKVYPLQTLKDNIGLLDEETLDKINEIVVKCGHSLKKKDEKLNVKIDTYVLETNVHFPTDINLLWDAGRKCIELIAHIIKDSKDACGWRKHRVWRKRLKAAYHKAAKRTVGAGRRTTKGLQAATEYLSIAEDLSNKIKKTRDMLNALASKKVAKINRLCELDYYEEHLDKHIELVRRRLILGQTIPHEEKVFSLFEPHTQWIKKGKAGNKVELGLPLAVASDQYGFLLSHRIMIKEQDVDIAIPFTEALVKKYDNIGSISFDKGCWSPTNHDAISEIVPLAIMPKKGKLNQEEHEREHAREFKALRNAHAAVESDINCLEHHGLNRCPDKGLPNFKRYTAFGILAYNLHRLGNILLEQEREYLSKNNKAA